MMVGEPDIFEKASPALDIEAVLGELEQEGLEKIVALSEAGKEEVGEIIETATKEVHTGGGHKANAPKKVATRKVIMRSILWARMLTRRIRPLQ